MGKGNMIDHLGIEFVEVGPDYLRARMPVDNRTRQPLGLLHGGASVTLAETLGSLASTLIIDLGKESPVGLEINANHVKSVRDGWVNGKVSPIHLGKSTHVWHITVTNERDELVSISRITVAVLTNNKP